MTLLLWRLLGNCFKNAGIKMKLLLWRLLGNCFKNNNNNNTDDNDLDDQEAEMFLPVEILREIFCRLPVKSLARCKSVCMLWYEIIQDHHFLVQHWERSVSVYEYEENKNVNGDDQEVFEWHQVKYGLVLEKNISTAEWRIRNPTTGYSLAPPHPPQPCRQMRIFYLPRTNEYKLVYIYFKNGATNGGCQVLRIGTDLAWRSLDCASFYDLGNGGGWVRAIPTDDVYFLFRYFKGGPACHEIVCLEVENERFVYAKTPRALLANSIEPQPVSWGANFSLVHLVERELHVWVLEDYKEDKWSERRIILPPTLFGNHPHTIENLRPCPCHSTSSNWLWFARIDGSRVGYNTESKEEYIWSPPAGKKILYSTAPSLVMSLEKRQAKPN